MFQDGVIAHISIWEGGARPARGCVRLHVDALQEPALPSASSREGREDLEVCQLVKRPDPVQGRASPPPTTLRAMSSLQTVSGSFDSPTGLLFIFRSRYLFAIGLSCVFSFRWNAYHPLCAAIPNNATRDVQLVRLAWARPRGCHPLWRSVPRDLPGPQEAGLIWRLRLQFASLSQERGDSGLSSSLFTRSYWGNPG